MSKIEFNCSACNTLLRVDESHAGKKARCPKCNMVHDVPGGQKTTDGGISNSGPSTGGFGNTGSIQPADMPTHVLGGNWELRSADGQVYGPVDKQELDEWAAEGRVSPNCYLRQQNGEWFPAEQIYPQVSGAAPKPAANHPHYVGDQSPGHGNYSNPYADPTHAGYAPNHPYVTPLHPGALRPHSGVAILICGILGICCCGILGIIAWIMGSRDLSAMKNGTMDPSGHGLVMAGYVMGIIGVLLNLGVILLSCLTDGMNF